MSATMHPSPQALSGTWLEWTAQRSSVWNHVHATGVLLWQEKTWLNTGSTFLLCDGTACDREAAIDPLLPGEVCGFQLMLPPAALGPIVDGLHEGALKSGLLPGISETIVFNVSRQAAPMSEPRLESAPLDQRTAKSWRRWPRYCLDFQSGSLSEHFGPTFYRQLEGLDSKLSSDGQGTLSEISVRLGVRTNDEHYSAFNSAPTLVRLIAPIYVHASEPTWQKDPPKFSCLLDVGRSVPRRRLSVVLGESERRNAPAHLEPDSASPIPVVLSTHEPGGGSKIRVFFDRQLLQEISTQSYEQPGILSGSFDALWPQDATAPAEPQIADLPRGLIATIPPSNRSDKRGTDAVPKGWTELGRGGFGTVYAARDEQIGVDFAIKIFDPSPFNAGMDAKTRFLREAGLLFKLHHENIVRIFDAGSLPDGRPFIKMERFPGPTLQDLLDERTLDIQEGVFIVDRLASAIEHAHALSICHRDMKPSNVLVARSVDQVRLIDFGLGILIEEAIARTRLTTTAHQFGNAYSAPELLENAKEVGPYLDVYSLGAIWFRIVCGRAPHGAGIDDEIRKSVIDDPLKDLLRGCLSRKENRLTVAQVLRRLREWQRTRVGLTAALTAPDTRRQPQTSSEAVAMGVDSDPKARTRLEAFMQSPHARATANVAKGLAEALRAIHVVSDKVAAFVEGHFSRSQSGYLVEADKGHAETQLFFARVGDGSPPAGMRFTVDVVDKDLVFSAGADSREFYRTTTVNPSLGDDFAATVEHLLTELLSTQID